MRVEIRNRAVRGRPHRVGRLAFLITVQTTNVQSLMHLCAITADASECPCGPWLTNRADEKSFFAALLIKSMIRRRQLKWLRAKRKRQPECTAQDRRCVEDQPQERSTPGRN